MVEYTFGYVNGGRNIGVLPWRDLSDQNYMYQIRERNVGDQASIELVKVDVRTGALEQQGGIWVYLGAPRLEELGACFNDPVSAELIGNIAGSVSGSKLYVTGHNLANIIPQFDSCIVEFDKTTLEVSNSWITGLTEDISRAGGHLLCNSDGTIVVQVGRGDLDIPDGYISLLNPATDEYITVSLSSLGIASSTCRSHMVFQYNTPGCFDSAGKFWFITQPVEIATGTLTGKSVLRKATLTAAPLGLVLDASYEIDDDYHAYSDPPPPGGLFSFADSYRHVMFYYNASTDRLILFSAWDAVDNATAGLDESWLLEFNPATGAVTRGPVEDLLVNCNHDFGRLDGNANRYSGDYIAIGRKTLGLGDSTHLRVLQVSTGTFEDHALTSFVDFTEPDDTNNWSLFFSEGSQIIFATDLGYMNNAESPFQEYLDGLFVIILDAEEEDGFVGGSGAQMEPIGIAFELVPFALAQSAMNSCIELGPFRFAEQKQADESAQISSMILGLSQQAIGIVVEEDYMTSTNDDEDWNEEVDQDSDDIYEDWSEGSGDSDDFTLMLRSTDDGINAQFQGDETLDWIEDFGSSKTYVPTGYSAIFHRVHICAHEVDEYWAVKTIDIAGVLTGRHL